jgi:molybdopterin-guanine dinucleotide biosynthesis protein A
VTRGLEIGIFVGGRGLRMGGVPKGNLPIGGQTVLERTLEICRQAALAPGDRNVPIWLIGDSSPYPAAGVLRISDDPRGVGPVGGLRAFLRELSQRAAVALVLAGDLPFVSVPLLKRLASEVPEAAALAPRDADGRWQPLFARYLPEVLLPHVESALAEARTSLQYLFERLGDRAHALELSPAEWASLHDWDRPSDMLAQYPEPRA